MTKERDVSRDILWRPEDLELLNSLVQGLTTKEVDIPLEIGDPKKEILSQVRSLGKEIASGKNPEDKSVITNELGITITPRNITDHLARRGEKKKFKREKDRDGQLVYRPTKKNSPVNEVLVEICNDHIEINVVRKKKPVSWEKVINSTKRNKIIEPFRRDVDFLAKQLELISEFGLTDPVARREQKRLRSSPENEGYIFFGHIDDFKTDVVNFAAIVLELEYRKKLTIGASPTTTMSVDGKAISTTNFGSLDTEFRQGRVLVKIDRDDWELLAIRSRAEARTHNTSSISLPKTDTTSFYVKKLISGENSQSHK